MSDLFEQAWGERYTPDVPDRDTAVALRMGMDALEDYANVSDGNIYNAEAEDALEAASEFFSAAAEGILHGEGLT